MKKDKLAYLYVGIAIFLWSTVASAFKVALKYLSVIQLLSIASISSTFILMIILIFERKTSLLFHMSVKELLISTVTALLNPVIYYIVLFNAYALLPAQVAQPLNYTWPLVLTVLAAIFLKQKISRANYFGIILSFFGATIVATRGKILLFNSLSRIGILLAILSAFIWATFWIINVKDHRDETLKLSLNFFIGTVFIVIIALIKKAPLNVDTRGIIPAIYIGFFEMGITYLLFLKALSLSSNTAKISNAIYLAPFLSLLFIRIIIKEKILPSTLIGLSLIVTGIVVNSSIVKKKPLI